MEKVKQYGLPIAIVCISLSVMLGRYVFSDTSTDTISNEEEIAEVSMAALLEMEHSLEEEVETGEREVEDYPLLVDVKGAVVSPGVYELTKGERVDHAIKKAGGLIADAEANAVNFAMHLTDEMLIYVPYKGEEVTVSLVSPETTEEKADQLIDINTADLTRLLELNGIGPQKAQSIIDYREANGLFKTIDELTDVSGIGVKTLEKIQNQITVN